MNARICSLLLAASLVAPPGRLAAQYAFTAHYVPGAEGIKAASLPPPGFYVRDYNLFYTADRLNTPSGSQAPLDFDAFVYANVLRGIWISNCKVLGGYFGMDALVPFIYTDLSIKQCGKPIYDHANFGVGDICFEPATLSWHGKQWDAAIGYSFWAPTGDSQPGTAKPGKGFWTQMLTAGGTFYFDQEKTWALSALNRYEFNLAEKDTDITPGQVWTLEWGLSKALSKTLDVGVAGYYQLQTTKDSGGASATRDVARDQVAAIGPEIVMFCPKLGLFTSLRYNYEFCAEDRPQGHTATLTLTKRF